VPRRQPERGRLWLADGSCARLRPARPNHGWAYDFVQDRTRDGKVLRMPVVVDEFSRGCLAIRAGRRLGSDDVLAVLAGLSVERGAPEHVRSDNGPEFAATAVRGWLARLGVGTLFIEPAGQPLGERLPRVVQRQAPGRAAGSGDLPRPAGGASAARGLAAAPRHGPPALGARLPTAGARGHPLARADTGAATTGRRPSR
jgi:hypothetical protein